MTPDQLATIPLFADLSVSEQSQISQYFYRETYQKDQHVLYAEQDNAPVYFISTGSIHLERVRKNGRRMILDTLETGEFFGNFLPEQENRNACVAKCVEKTELLAIARSNLFLLIEQYPALGKKIIAPMTRRLRRTTRQLSNVVLGKADNRLAYVISDVIEQSGSEEGDSKIRISKKKWNHKELAHKAGLTRETVSRILSDWKKANQVHEDKENLIIQNYDWFLSKVI